MTRFDDPSAHPYDARRGDGDPLSDPAAVGETSAEQPDGDGGAVPPGEAERAAQQRPA